MPFLIVGGVLFLLAVALLSACRWVYNKAFYVPEKKKWTDPRSFYSDGKDAIHKAALVALVDELEPCPYEAVSILSHDGLRLTGRYYHTRDGAPLKIIFHGWRSNALRDCGGGAKMAFAAGYNLLLINHRAHSDSDGNTITFGIKEKYDCLDWTLWAVDRFGKDVKIILGGISMGAATVLMASALDLPKNVKCISADCGYTSPEAIIRKVCRVDMGIPDSIGFPLIRMSARIFGRFSILDGGALEAVRHAKVPIMIMHGDEDDFVPFSMCGEIYDAVASEKTLLTVTGAGHGMSYFVETAGYEKALLKFESDALNR